MTIKTDDPERYMASVADAAKEASPDTLPHII